MSDLVNIVSIVNIVAFVALGVVAAVQWRARRSRAAAWAAIAFLSLAFVVVFGAFEPEHPSGFWEEASLRVLIAALVLFPYFLFRFTLDFSRPSRQLYSFVSAMSVVLLVWTFALPHVPESGEHRSLGFNLYIAAFMIHWTVLSVSSAWRLWRAGRGQPSVARRRMRLLSVAGAALTLAVVLLAAPSDSDSPLAAASGLLGTVSALAFVLGLAPPTILKLLWRHPEQGRIQAAVQSLIAQSGSEEEVAERVLGPVAAIVGARAVALRNDEGSLIGTHGTAAEGDEPLVISAGEGVSLLVWTSPYAPFFGSEELGTLRTLASLIALALDRVRLFEDERAARVQLERANQVKANFVALAAHELRTPVTTIHGFVQTLNHLGERLDDGQRERLQTALEQQTTRMAVLVEQLLDLSRLDADVIEIAPQRLQLRERIEEIVRAAAGGDAGAVTIEVAEGLEADVDPNAFDRVLSNLVTNAFRYGRPPVVVAAEQSDRHLRVIVEDRGEGVAPEFVPDLFERFSRSESSRAAAKGTGLGLAIARSYAQAHDGELLYEPVLPHGARFQLVLPAWRRA